MKGSEILLRLGETAVQAPRVSVGLPRLFVGDRGGHKALQELVDEYDTRTLGIIIWSSSENPPEATYLATAMAEKMRPNQLYEYIVEITCKIRGRRTANA